jgi:hypothetical protein
MANDELRVAGRAYRRIKGRSDAAHEDLKRLIIDAYKRGVGTMEIAEQAEHPRELVRRILLAAERAGEIVMRRPVKK